MRWPCQLDVARRGARHVLDRAHPAQHLLDRGGNARRVARQRLELLGIAQQLVHAAAQDVARRLVAADQDEQALHQQIVVAEALAVDLGVDQDADESSRGRRAAVGDHVALVGDVVVERRGAPASSSPGRWCRRPGSSPRTRRAGARGRPARRRGDRRSRSAAATPRRRGRSRIGRAPWRCSMRPALISRMRGSCSCTRRGVKPRLTSPRRCRWARIVEVDHVRHRRLDGPDAAAVAEGLRILRIARSRSA